MNIATRDYGGTGSPILLIHGFGRNLEDWAPLVPLLLQSHHVVAMDLRDHGASDDGPWSWREVITDIHAVVQAYEFPSLTIVGHSLGGMIAPVYAEAHAECKAIVNLDGHGRLSEHLRSRVTSVNVEDLPGGGKPFAEDDFGEVVQTMVKKWAALGVPEEIETNEVRRAVHHLGEGQLLARPAKSAAEQILALAWALDVDDWYRRVRCPSLIYNAVRTGVAGDVLGVSWWDEFHRKYKEDLRRDLAALAADCPHVTVETIDATHYLMIEYPEEIAQRIDAFIANAVIAQPKDA